ncbi:MAG TPA: Crp/Fnr family transcriptional regulator [Gemmatimonadaceae bacterium]|nr:Crp/Fnr family transcriptional regulator [Gemmatimonadaceae bacterium]
MISRDALARLPLFDRVAPQAIDALAARGTELAVPTDAVIFRAGSPPRGWFVVLEGRVRVVRGSGARQHVIHTEGPGGTLGEVPLVAGGTYPATSIAAEPTRCALFDRASLEAAIAECPEIAFLLAGRLASRVRSLVARLDERSATSVRARLIDFLLRRHAATALNSFSIGMTQQDLAEELGTVREVVVRELRHLKENKLIVARPKGRFQIPDPAALHNAVDR